MASLPTEIIDLILERVYYNVDGTVDVQTLHAAARICRSWTAPAQRLLFRRVSLLGSASTRLSSFSFGRLGEHIRVLEIGLGSQSSQCLDEAGLVELLHRTPRLYELTLQVATGLHQLETTTTEALHRLARPRVNADGQTEKVSPVRVRALTLLSCGIQSPILYQLLSIWPCVEFLYLGFEIAAPPPKYQPTFKLYQLSLARTPRFYVLSWLLSSSIESLRILNFRDVPGHEFDPILDRIGGQLRSLRLTHWNLRAASILKHCPNLEEFVVMQLSTVIKLANLPQSLEHLHCRGYIFDEEPLGPVIEVVGGLPKLRIITCSKNASSGERFGELENLCNSRGIELYLDATPFWMVSAVDSASLAWISR